MEWPQKWLHRGKRPTTHDTNGSHRIPRYALGTRGPRAVFVAFHVRPRAAGFVLDRDLLGALKRTLSLSAIGVPIPVQRLGPVGARK